MADEKKVEVPETGPYLSLVNTPRGWVVRGIWLQHKTVTKSKDFFGPSPSRLEADDQLRIAVVEHILS